MRIDARPEKRERDTRHTPNITASALSQHLNLLKTAGILSSEKQGMNVRYWISDTRVIALIESIKEQYCKEETL